MTSNAELADRLEKALRERPGVRAVEELVRTNSAAILTALRSEPAAGMWSGWRGRSKGQTVDRTTRATSAARQGEG